MYVFAWRIALRIPSGAGPPRPHTAGAFRDLALRGANRRYPQGVPDKVRKLLDHELALIGDLHYEAYFLTVWDLVRFARSRNILCQGRGSAANSAVCFCLGVTSVDPDRTDVLFERFVSRERNEAPDIDVDFEHERREEVLQYLYEKYGRERSGMTAVVITYRARSRCGMSAKRSASPSIELMRWPSWWRATPTNRGWSSGAARPESIPIRTSAGGWSTWSTS